MHRDCRCCGGQLIVNGAVVGGQAVWTRDVLNLGVGPDKLIAAARRRFEVRLIWPMHDCAYYQ
eukprot:scaffold363391_cov28-Prasinocladus_malaysianus.AAC.1